MLLSLLKYAVGGVAAALILFAMIVTELGYPYLSALAFFIGVFSGFIFLKIKDTWR